MAKSTTVPLIQTSLKALSILLMNPKIAGSHIDGAKAASFLTTLDQLIELGKEGHEDLQGFSTDLETMANENRGPTPAEEPLLLKRAQDVEKRLGTPVKETVEEPVITLPSEVPEVASPTEE